MPRVAAMEESKTVEAAQDYRPLIISQLQAIYNLRQVNDAKSIQLTKYKNILDELMLFPEPIYSMETLADIKSIGSGTRQKIQEIFDTGMIRELRELSPAESEKVDIILSFMTIHGIGIKDALKLYKKGIRSLAELRERDPAEHLLKPTQRTGLRNLEDLQEKIPRAEMHKHNAYITTVITILRDKYVNFGITIEFEVVGSYRRECALSSDIDVLLKVTGSDTPSEVLRDFASIMEAENYITDFLTRGRQNIFAICKLKNYKRHRRIDIKLTKETEYAPAKVHFTGSYQFNTILRKIANQQGFTVNEHEICYLVNGKKGEPIAEQPQTETELFGLLGIPYIEPKDRTADVLRPYLNQH